MSARVARHYGQEKDMSDFFAENMERLGRVTQLMAALDVALERMASDTEGGSEFYPTFEFDENGAATCTLRALDGSSIVFATVPRAERYGYRDADA